MYQQLQKPDDNTENIDKFFYSPQNCIFGNPMMGIENLELTDLGQSFAASPFSTKFLLPFQQIYGRHFHK